MEPKNFFILLLIFIINTNLTFEESCQKITCTSSLSNGMCIKVQSLESLFQECPAGQICAPDSDDPIQDAYCVESKKNNFKKLPTLPCENNDDCLSGICKGNKCIGKMFGETCQSASDCYYDYTCRKDSDNEYKCLEPITTGNKCEMDTDCVHESGCLNNICTKYFSLENNQRGSDVGNQYLSFCKSGYSDYIGICQNLSLINETEECNEEKICTYKNTLTGELIKKEENCLCGYNPEQKKYCLFGSAN